jgi:uncharacterized protein (DUF885 family)
MHRSCALGMILVLGIMGAGVGIWGQAPVAAAPVKADAAAAPAEPAWVVRSNGYVQELLDVQLKHSPEQGSAQGISKYDPLITDGTRADEIAQRKELEEILARLAKVEEKEKDANVREDLEIVEKAFHLQFRVDDYQLDHKVQFLDASEVVFIGLRTLLDDQVAADRRSAAVARLKKYAGVEPGFQPFTEVLKQRAMEQMAKPGVVYPSIDEMETELGRDKNYVDGIAALFRKYKLTGWEDAYAKLSEELGEYDTWVRSTLLPKGRKDFKLLPEEYALALEGYGVAEPPQQLAAEAHAAFTEIQSEMAPLAAQVAKEHGWKSADYRDVIHEMKKTQVTGDAILPLYQGRLKAIEDIIAAMKLVTLPDRPAIIRLATAAETAQQPAPHMSPPPLLHNTGQRGEFVLPLNIPSSTGGASDQYDDFTFDAAAWPLTSHEARPGHELQFDSMVEHGVSLARALYAFNSTNAEGWGLYAEWMVQPYEPIDGQLVTLDYRLARAARAFLDPELQSGTITEAEAYKVLEFDVVLSSAFAKEEVERYTYRAPGQANSYFYGYTKLMELRKDTEAALGAKFNQQRYHDFLLAQGLLPPDLLRKAVMEEFVPSQKK